LSHDPRLLLQDAKGALTAEQEAVKGVSRHGLPQGRDDAEERLTLCERGHSFKRGENWYHVFCFAQREHAERFQARFGGEMIDQAKQPRWPSDKMR
jgi:hypothetical protein